MLYVLCLFLFFYLILFLSFQYMERVRSDKGKREQLENALRKIRTAGMD